MGLRPWGELSEVSIKKMKEIGATVGVMYCNIAPVTRCFLINGHWISTLEQNAGCKLDSSQVVMSERRNVWTDDPTGN